MSVALWWAIFTTPLITGVKESKIHKNNSGLFTIIKIAFQNLYKTGLSIKQYKSAVIFLLAYFLYMDGVDTIIRMATSYGADIGLFCSIYDWSTPFNSIYRLPSYASVWRVFRQIWI